MIELKEQDGYFPILWFGNREEYKKSKIKVITVALNPSETEFCNDDKVRKFNNSFRFPNWKNSLEDAYNEYFEYKPYNWFNNFEYVLRGFGASYGGKKLKIQNDKKCGEAYLYRAIHTDLCTPYATRPAWAGKIAQAEHRQNEKDKEDITKTGIKIWEILVDILKPDIIIACIPQEYREKLIDSNSLTEIIRVVKTKDGEDREPVKILAGEYKGALIIFGMTKQVPFGNVSTIQKKLIGENIGKCYNLWKKTRKLSSVKIGKDSIVG